MVLSLSHDQGCKHIMWVMSWCYRVILLIVGCVTLLSTAAQAQEVEYDYRYYKFYDTEEESLVLLEGRISSRFSDIPVASSRSEYVLRSLNFRYMGERGSERNIFGGAEIDYTTSRLLSGLRFSSSDDEGFGGNYLSTPLYRTRRYDMKDEYTPANSLGVALSGRRSLGRVSYFGYYKPDYHGVLLVNGWEYRYSARLSVGNDLYVKGVYGDMADLAFAATYRDRRSTLHLVALLPYSKRGLSRASVEEAYQLLGDRQYNPLWGMQGGKVRNSREASLLRPEALLLWNYRLTVATSLTLTLDVSHSAEGVSSLSWYNAPTPIPDNYHYLPSYYALSDEIQAVRNVWLSNDLRYTQIDWEGLYHTNALQSDGHARYAVESRREDVARGGVTASFKTALKGVDVEYGLSLNADRVHRYKVLEDMLGATHIDNLDYFFVDDATNTNGLKNNLRCSDVRVREGDTFGYNYLLMQSRASLFGGIYWSRENLNISLFANMATERYIRKGLYESELFPGAGSWGDSQRVALTPYSVVAAASYTFENHAFGATFALEGAVPGVDNLFYNPDYNNRLVDNLVLTRSSAVRLGYGYSPNTKLLCGAQLFALHRSEGCRVIRYYDDLAGVYSNGLVEGISRMGYGADLHATVSWNRILSSNFRAIMASYRYVDDATLRLYSDSDNMLLRDSRVVLDGLHSGASEFAIYGDISYSYRDWNGRVSLSWCDGGYIEPGYASRTEGVLSYAISAKERQVLMAQRALPSATSLDFSLSRTIDLAGGESLVIRVGVNNLLGGSWVVQGYESNRMRMTSDGDFLSIRRGADALRYSYPRMLSLSINCRF